MRFFRPGPLLLFSLFLCASALAQQPPSAIVATSDPQAVALLEQSVSAFGSIPPLDSTANGSVTITAGSLTTQGAVTIWTKGTAQTSIQFQMPDSTWSVIYSQGQASRTDGTTSTPLSLEAASTSQCVYFPLPYLAGVLQSPDTAYQYVGSETLGGASVQHVRVWNTFQSNPSWQLLANFTMTDIWFDSLTGLPRRISFVHREGSGSVPGILVTVDYLSFQKISGVLYPGQIQQSVNGTPWLTASIQSVALNTGLTDANFPIAGGGN